VILAVEYLGQETKLLLLLQQILQHLMYQHGAILTQK
jgi:fucose 4-O-acetylase-like acetyltransferase